MPDWLHLLANHFPECQWLMFSRRARRHSDRQSPAHVDHECRLADHDGLLRAAGALVLFQSRKAKYAQSDAGSEARRRRKPQQEQILLANYFSRHTSLRKWLHSRRHRFAMIFGQATQACQLSEIIQGTLKPNPQSRSRSPVPHVFSLTKSSVLVYIKIIVSPRRGITCFGKDSCHVWARFSHHLNLYRPERLSLGTGDNLAPRDSYRPERRGCAEGIGNAHEHRRQYAAQYDHWTPR